MVVSNNKLALLLFLAFSYTEWSCFRFCKAQNTTNTIKPGQTLRFSEKLLVSADGSFQLGFFNISGSSNKFLGIRFTGKTYDQWVWVANREHPIDNSSAVLKMDSNGLLEINSGSVTISLNPDKTSPESTAILQNSGNLVIKDSNTSSDKILWQSFDQPSDTLLPGMKLGSSNWLVLVSWLSKSNPTPGPFTLDYDPKGDKDEPFIVKRRGKLFQRYGKELLDYYWSGARLNFVENSESYFSYSSRNTSDSGGLFLKIEPDGRVAHGSLNGTVTRLSDCNGGVNYPSDCASGSPECRVGKDNFVRRELSLNSSTFSARYTVDDQGLAFSDCLDLCWRNCTCVGFNTLYSDETGCEFWSKEAAFEESRLYGDQFFILNSTYNNYKYKSSGLINKGMKWWICVMVFVVAIWL